MDGTPGCQGSLDDPVRDSVQNDLLTRIHRVPVQLFLSACFESWELEAKGKDWGGRSRAWH